jgi:serine/threonine-protein kinase
VRHQLVRHRYKTFGGTTTWTSKALGKVPAQVAGMMSEPFVDLAPGAMVGSYRLVREIGRGGMGTVFEARHSLLTRRAALKVMHSELRRQPGMATRVVQEATILEDLRHPGVVRVFDCNVLPDHRPWIAMELVDGETLANRLVRCGSLAPLEVATLIAEVADVLAAVHAHGVVHRDLKPDNLILTPADRAYPLRVIDWGVARLGPLGRVTLDGLTPGTPIYMSPEQATGKNIAAPCDVYSLGVIAYEALASRPPFDGRTLAEVVCMHLGSEPQSLVECARAPRELCNLVHRMLAKEPAHRPGAIEVRQIARAIARDLAGDYESFELVTAADARARGEVVDAESLEFGVTELLPAMRKPRWTPDLDLATLPAAVTAPPRAPITPKAYRDEVAGEIAVPKRREA